MMVVRTVFAGLLLTAAIGWTIAQRAILLATGREIVVASKPVDARELFRGDYVGLVYDFSNMPFSAVEGGRAASNTFAASDFYVVLKPLDGRYVLDHASFTPPQPAPDTVVLRGKAGGSAGVTPSVKLSPTFGIERYFVPEGKAQSLPAQMPGDRIDVVLAVGNDGQAAIKALRIGGKDIYREGLF